jgi:hypothetical protein
MLRAWSPFSVAELMNGNREVKYSGDKAIGVPQILRAFVRVFYATSTEGAMLLSYISLSFLGTSFL